MDARTKELADMKNLKHSYLMIGLLVIGAVLFLTGSGGGLAFLLFPLGCMAMMFFMMRGMSGVGGMHGRRDHTHDDGVTHSHDDALTHSHDQATPHSRR
jgi:hypothetical protein